MLRKTAIYFSLFIGLFLLNFFLQIKLSSRLSRDRQVKNILAEIEEQYNSASQFNFSNAPFATGPFSTEVKTSDGRAANLKHFFRKHNSVLYDYAEYIVKTSDKYGFDYRLLPAIAFQESTLCRAIPKNSYNCWGWGIYGTTVTRFVSYEDAIDTVAAGLKKNYLDRGLNTASKIMAVYTPSSNGSWAHGVNTFLKALE